MENFNFKFDWKQLVDPNAEGVSHTAFDERSIYRAIRKKNIDAMKINNKGYLLLIKHNPAISSRYYSEILTKFFCISEYQVTEHILRLENNGQLAWNNLSSSIAELLIIEVQKYLAEKNINLDIITKKVEENAVKKPGNDFA